MRADAITRQAGLSPQCAGAGPGPGQIRPWLLVLLAAAAYAAAYAGWYARTPLGRVPVLDERENLALAEEIAGGTLPAQPFYRAMGYPLLLAGFREAGVPSAQLPLAALWLGAGLHVAGAVLAGSLAARWFNRPGAGLAGGLLFAFHPVLLHESVQRLDGALGTALFLAGLLCLCLERESPPRWAPWAASACWGAAVLVRPQFLTVWCVLPFLWWWRLPGRRGLAAAAGTVIVAAALLGAQGAWQKRIGGEFRVLPWQGAYNLWSSNRPGTSGRYYSQAIDLSHPGEADNPAKLESMILYAQATGKPATDISAMNTYWRGRFFAQIRGHPLAWLKLLARKAYALLNDWEQYNNKTYAFHKSLSPWLRWNPLGWGVVLLLAVTGFFRLQAAAPRVAGATGAIAAAAAAGVLLFYVSSRFRLPLAALGCVAGGGAFARPGWIRGLSAARRNALALTLLAAAALAFSRFDGVRDRRPIVQDHLLLARAAQVTGDDAAAWREAVAAEALEPGRRDADELVVTGGFNRLLAGPLSPTDRALWQGASRRLAQAGPPSGDPAALIAAFVRRDLSALHALARTELRPGACDAAGALVLLGAADPAEIRLVLAAPETAGTTLFLLARQETDPSGFAQAAGSGRPAGWNEALAAARRRMLAAVVAP